MRWLPVMAALMLGGCAGMVGPSQPSPFAETQTPTTAVADAPFDAPAGVYTLDPRHTSVIFRVRHMSYSTYTGRFDRAAGALTFDPAAPARSRLNATVDIASVSTGLKDKDGKLSFDQEIAKVLGIDTAAQARFVAAKITRTGEKTALIDGDLTLNGRTKPAQIQATLEGYANANALFPRPRFGFSGHAFIKRSDFGASSVIFSLFAGDDVEMIIETEFEKEQG
jgi:polyisoprenoid-binding protein YceI